MNKLYPSRINWRNEPSTETPIDEINLNKIDKFCDDIDNRVIEMDTRVSAIEDIEPTVLGYMTRSENAASNSEAYAVGKRGGSDVPSSDPTYHNNSKYYSEQAATSVTTAQGYALDASNSATSASGSVTAAQGKVEDAEAWAVGKRNGESVPSSDPTYNNNSKYYSDRAVTASTTATTAADLSTQNAEIAEAYAVGKRNGVDVPTTDVTYHNNSKYYSEIASTASSTAVTSATNASTSETNAITAATDAFSYEELSKSYAIGTGGLVRQGDQTDNSKYYSQVSAEKASDAATILQQVRDYASLVIPQLLLDPTDGCLYVEILTGKTVDFLLDDGILYYKFVAA